MTVPYYDNTYIVCMSLVGVSIKSVRLIFFIYE